MWGYNWFLIFGAFFEEAIKYYSKTREWNALLLLLVERERDFILSLDAADKE